MASMKNTLYSPAAQDLGLGDSLKMQLDDLEEERKKKLLQQAQAAQRAANPMGGAVQTLFGSGIGA